MDRPTALITGASSGIGRQLALTFAQAGYDVVINYSRSMESAKDVASECEQFGARTLIYGCDVSETQSVKAMIDLTLSTFGKIDVLINNSGITKDQLLLRMSETDFDDVIAVNLKGTFNCTQQVLKPMLRAKKGRIICMSSVIGVSGNAGQSNYAASKGGIIAFTKSVAREVASRGITVNAIAPGFIATRMTEVLNPEQQDSILKQIPLNRFGQPEDVANCALFLASEQASYITGQVIHVDGGMVM